MLTTSHLFRRVAMLLAVGVSTLALGACGSDSDDASSGSGAAGTSSTADDQDSGRVKLTQCLRENGVDVPDNPGPRTDVDPDKLQEALSGPCKELQTGAFGEADSAGLQEFRDAFSKFAQCMRRNGVDVPDLGPNDGPAQIHGLFDPADPRNQGAMATCQDKIPQRMPGGG